MVVSKAKGTIRGLTDKLTQNETVKRYFYNTGWLLADRVIRLISVALLGIIIARYLGPSDYGFLNYALAYVAIFIPISGLGLGDVASRELVHKRYSEKELLGTLFYLRLSGSALCISIVNLAVFLSDNEPIIKVLVPIISFALIFQSSDVLDRFFQSHVKAKYTAQASVTALGVTALIKIALVIFKAHLVWFAVVYTLEFAVQSTILALRFRKFKRRFSELIFNPRLALEFIKESWALILSGLMVMLYMRIDQIMIKDMLGADGPKAVGNYTAAVKISEATYIIPVAIVNSLLPAMVSGMNMGREVFRQRLQKLYDLMTWLSLPLAILVSIFSSTIALVFGDKFVGVGDVLAIHIWGVIFVYWGTINAKWYVIEKMTRYVTLNTLAGCLINIGLNLYLIPSIGIKGAAIATLVAQIVTIVITPLFFSRTRMIFGLMLRSLNPVAAAQRIKTLRYAK